VVSEERLKKVGETYRQIRNTLRYQLSNLYDFDPSVHAVSDGDLTPLDRWILGEFGLLEAEVAAAYSAHEFHMVYQKLSQFIAVQLSALFHDVVKDRLYTDAVNSPRRRSTQTALHRMVTRLCQILSPMLVFTAEEAWEFVPGRPTASVHLSVWSPDAIAADTVLQPLLTLRDGALAELEKARQAKQIGKALDAVVHLALSGAPLAAARSHPEVLREILNVSAVEISEATEVAVRVQPASETGRRKCDRCWHWELDLGVNAQHPTLCGRCAGAVTALMA